MMLSDVEEDGGMVTKHSRQALECLEVPSIENGTAGQFQVGMIVIIILKIIGNWPTCCQSQDLQLHIYVWCLVKIICNYLYDALSKIFAAALGSDEVGRVTLPTDRPRDTPCYQGDCDTQIVYLLSSYFVFLQLHWMRQTFNNKNQKTYDEYRQGCRWFIVLDYSKSNHIFVWQNWTVLATFFCFQVFVHPAEGGPGIELLRRRGGWQPEKEVEKGEKIFRKVWAERNPS